MKKTSLLIGVLALASFAFAAGKSYSVTLSKPSKVGSLQLAAGSYQVKVDGANAVFTDAKRHSFSTAVKVENGSRKFEYTAVDSTDSGNTELVHSITLGGSVTKIEFGDSAATN
jgi:hypothetical protein